MSKIVFLKPFIEKERASYRHHHIQSHRPDQRFDYDSGMNDSDVIPQHVFEESKRNQPDVDNLNYEQLLELGDKIGHVSKGFSMYQIKKINEFKWAPFIFTDQKECPIC